MVEITDKALSKAMFNQGFEVQLQLRRFVDVFFDRRATIDAPNPFIAEDFVRIDPRQIFEFDGADA